MATDKNKTKKIRSKGGAELERVKIIGGTVVTICHSCFIKLRADSMKDHTQSRKENNFDINSTP